MKKLFKLIWLETSFLKRTLIVIFVILTAFSSAFLAILSVIFDTPKGIIDGIDAGKKHYFELYGGESLALSAPDKTADFAERYDAALCYGTIEGTTQNAVLSFNDNVFESDIVTKLGSGEYKLEYRVERHGYFVPAKYARQLKYFAPFEGEKGILLCNEAAKELKVKAGQNVELNGREWTVLAVFNKSKVAHDYTETDSVVPAAWYYVVDDSAGVRFDELYLTYPSAETTFAVWKKAPNVFTISKIFEESHENIALVQTYYGYLAILLGALNLFLLYVLFSLFFRSRKTQICRFKLLGATDITVAGIYLVIALVLIVASIAVASAFSVLISKFILDLCGKLFRGTYTYHYRVWLPFSLLGAFVLLAVVNFALLQRKVSRVPIAEEVRYE